MSVLFEFAMFPTDKGESVSEYVGRIIKGIDGRGAAYKLTPMGTVVEVDGIDDALDIIKQAYAVLEPDCTRVYSSIKFDIRKGKSGRLTQKIESVEKKIGKEVKK